jgi:hypothetical protein
MREPYRSKITRHVELTILNDGRLYVEIRRPQKREMVTRRYKPKPASLDRVKRLVCYSLGPNGRWLEGEETVGLIYWHTF